MSDYTWPDGTPKSRGNAFDWRGRQSVITEGLRRSAIAGKASSEYVNKRRKEGVDVANIPGLSDRRDRRNVDAKRFHVGGMVKKGSK